MKSHCSGEAHVPASSQMVKANRRSYSFSIARFAGVAVVAMHSSCGSPEEQRSLPVTAATADASTMDATGEMDLESAIDTRLAELEARGGEPLPRAWSHATTADFQAIGTLTRQLHPGMESAWRSRLEAVQGPRSPHPEQFAALAVLTEDPAANLDVLWNDARGTPSSVTGINFVLRGATPDQVWQRFLATNNQAIRDLFGLSPQETLDVVEQTNRDDFTVIALQRRYSGVIVTGELLQVRITRDESPFGAGVLWAIDASAERDIATRMPSAAPETWIGEAQARAIASASGNVVQAIEYISCGQRCVPYWNVLFADGGGVTVDAVSGASSQPSDRQSHGTLYIGSYPPGATSLTPVRFRGAAILNSGGSYYGSTSPIDGTWTSAPASALVGLQGAQATSGAWPTGRVDHTSSGSSFGTLQTRSVAWTPSTQPNRNFGSDSWLPGATNTTAHRDAVQYGWESYLQDLFNRVVLTQVPDTLTYENELSPNAGTGWGTCSTGVWDHGELNSGQQTWGHTSCGAFATDNVSAFPTADFGHIAHEYAHTVQACANVSGASCDMQDPLDQATRPADPTTWRPWVWGSHKEDMPDSFAQILVKFTTSPGVAYKPDWHYGGYFSTTDDFATLEEFPQSGLGCNPSVSGTTPCPTGFSCLLKDAYYSQNNIDARESPSGIGYGICVKDCLTDADCPAPSGYFCQPSQPPGSSTGFVTTSPTTSAFCYVYNYDNEWFSITGGRLSVAIGPIPAMRDFLTAAAGNSNAAARDFVGTDSWHHWLAQGAIHDRYEISRAVLSTSSVPGEPSYDDFTDFVGRATPVSVVSTSGTQIAWGNGPSQYPYLEDWNDSDNIVFRGIAGSSYTISAQPLDSSSAVDLGIFWHAWVNDGATVVYTSTPTGPSASVTTGPLPSTGWYYARIATLTNTKGAWVGTISLNANYDEYSDLRSEAHPMITGVWRGGKINATNDVDAFAIDVPTSTAVTIESAASSTIAVYQPSGGLVAIGTGSVTIASASAGRWWWTVSGASGLSYQTRATLACAASSPACDNFSITEYAPSPPSTPTRLPLVVRNSWGDSWGARLPTASSVVRYAIDLVENEEVSFSVPDSESSCQLRMDLYGPESMLFWTSSLSSFVRERIWRWTDGGGVGDLAGTHPGVAGHFTAPVSGRYTVEVGSTNGSACPWLRVLAAKSDFTTTPMPAW